MKILKYSQPLFNKRPDYTKFVEHVKLFVKKSSTAIKAIFLNLSMIIPFIMDSFFNMLHQDRIAWGKV